MAWNEPGKGNGDRQGPTNGADNDSGDNNKDQDPWGVGNNRGDAPPDLDEVVRNFQDKISGIFGGNKKRRRPANSSNGGSSGANAGFFGLILLAVAGYAVYNMVYIVDEPERGVVLRFGKYVDTIQPGLNVRLPPPIEKVYKVNVRRIQPVTHQASMLTRDENIVDVDIAVQYRVDDARNYLFNIDRPDFTLKKVQETSVREVIGRSDMDFILTEGRTKIESDTKELMQSILNQYEAGLLVESVNMQSAKPPEAAKSAFDDVIKAREDRERLINQAQAYRNEVLPKARGEAVRKTEDALAYEARVEAQAKGDASRFEQLLSAYEQAPQVTRERLYLDAMEAVFYRNKKIFLDTGSGNNILYLPLGDVSNQNIPKPVFQSQDHASSQSQNRRKTSEDSEGQSKMRQRGSR